MFSRNLNFLPFKYIVRRGGAVPHVYEIATNFGHENKGKWYRRPRKVASFAFPKLTNRISCESLSRMVYGDFILADTVKTKQRNTMQEPYNHLAKEEDDKKEKRQKRYVVDVTLGYLRGLQRACLNARHICRLNGNKIHLCKYQQFCHATRYTGIFIF